MLTVGYPLLLIPVAIYNIFVFLMPGVALNAPAMSLRLPSGAIWAVSLGDMLLALGIVMLLLEFLRAARPGAKYLTDHGLSLLLCAGATAEFLLLAPFATSVFVLLAAMSAVDFLAGVALALRYRRWARADEAEQVAPLSTACAVEPEPSFEKTEPVTPTAVTTPPIEHRPQSRAAAEVITPAVDSVPEQTDRIATSKLPPSDHIPDPEPAIATKPARSVSDWSVSDLVADRDKDAAIAPNERGRSPQ